MASRNINPRNHDTKENDIRRVNARGYLDDSITSTDDKGNVDKDNFDNNDDGIFTNDDFDGDTEDGCIDEGDEDNALWESEATKTNDFGG